MTLSFGLPLVDPHTLAGMASMAIHICCPTSPGTYHSVVAPITCNYWRLSPQYPFPLRRRYIALFSRQGKWLSTPALKGPHAGFEPAVRTRALGRISTISLVSYSLQCAQPSANGVLTLIRGSTYGSKHIDMSQIMTKIGCCHILSNTQLYTVAQTPSVIIYIDISNGDLSLEKIILSSDPCPI